MRSSPTSFAFAVTWPSYAMYGVYAQIYGLTMEPISYVPEHFTTPAELCSNLPPGLKVLFLPNLMLKYFLAPGGEPEAPLADRIVTVGEHTAQLLSANGHKPERIRVGGALQMHGLRAELPPDSSKSKHAPTVLVAPYVGLEEAAELVDMAIHLFTEKDGVRVVVKCHPRLPFEKIQKLINTRLPQHVHVSEEAVTDLMQSSSLMVYTGSTVCIEAIAIGLPVVHLRTRFDLDLDPLEETPDARLEATGLRELRQQVRWLLDRREEYVAAKAWGWNILVEQMFGRVSEKTYRAFVD